MLFALQTAPELATHEEQEIYVLDQGCPKVPEGQTQSYIALPPVRIVVEPFGQSLQKVDSGLSEYFPISQTVQKVLPGSALYDPLAHLAHIPEASWLLIVPGAQSKQVVDLAKLYFPRSQNRQEKYSSTNPAKVPSRQDLHS